MIDEQIALETPDGFEIKTVGESVTGKVLFADGGDGHEKEATERDPVAGASSTAPASSGIPSAMTQQGVHAGKTHAQETAHTDETQMGNRDIPRRQNVKP